MHQIDHLDALVIVELAVENIPAGGTHQLDGGGGSAGNRRPVVSGRGGNRR